MSLLTAFIAMSQEIPDGIKESQGGPWQFIGLLPLFDPPRHDSAETIRRALNLGVNVKMITGICPLQCIIYSKAESNALMFDAFCKFSVLSVHVAFDHYIFILNYMKLKHFFLSGVSRVRHVLDTDR